MTRRKGHEAVLNTLQTAISLISSTGLKKVKLNVVIIRNLNEDEVCSFAELTRSMPISIRFIEFMPFHGNKWDVGKMVPSKDLLDRLRSRYPSIGPASATGEAGAEAEFEANDTAKTYRIPEYKGTIGFISSMSDHFCGTCNRLRLTADGMIKASDTISFCSKPSDSVIIQVCLFDAKEVSLLQMMRAGASDEELLSVIGKAVGGKKVRHAGMENIDVVHNRSMIKIGLSNLFTFIISICLTNLVPLNFSIYRG
jgi:molybdenum cofactor biosynthesis enzyme MoaA